MLYLGMMRERVFLCWAILLDYRSNTVKLNCKCTWIKYGTQQRDSYDSCVSDTTDITTGVKELANLLYNAMAWDGTPPGRCLAMIVLSVGFIQSKSHSE